MAAVAVMAASGGYFAAMMLSQDDASSAVQTAAITAQAMAANQIEDLVGRSRPDFTLRDIQGVPVSMEAFRDQVVLINFWATWCTPCVEEMPMLSRLQEQFADQRMQVVGIALDDPQKAGDFASQLEIGYPILVGTTDAILVGRQFGNRAGMLPYSVLVDREGVIQWTHLGALERQELETQIRALF
jgi:peroxiredoxin